MRLENYFRCPQNVGKCQTYTMLNATLKKVPNFDIVNSKCLTICHLLGTLSSQNVKPKSTTRGVLYYTQKNN